MPKRCDETMSIRTVRLTAALSLLAGTPAALAQGLGEVDLSDLAELVGQGADAPEVSSDAQPSTGHVNVDEYEQIELHFRDEDIATALQLLAMQSERSIVTTQNVSGTVTANLYGVSFEEALDAILLYNGFGYIEQGGTIYVMPKEDILAWEQAQRKMETAVIRLNYLNAVDAAQFAQSILSPEGTITTNGVTPDFQLNDSVPVGKDDYSLDAVLVVRDYPEQIQEIRDLVAQLDTKPMSVLVEATILQKSISDAYGYGVDFSILSNLEFLEFVGAGGPLGVVDSLIKGEKALSGDSGDSGGTAPLPSDGGGTGIVQSVGNTSGPGGLKIGVVSNDVAVFVRLLDEMGDTTILSNPKVLTLNRQPASVQVGRRIGYLSTTTTDTTTQQTVEFLDTGTQLYFRPFATASGDIRLELRPEVSQPIIRSVTDATGAAVTVPDEDTSQLSTNVLVRDGQTVVLGGLFTERTTSSRRQVPVLGDVPIFGHAFRGEDNSVDRAEIIFLITPSIVEDESMADAGIRALEEVDFARAGAREGLLFWSRERRASQLLVDAQRLAAEGETRRALNKVQRALALQPTMSDAIRLREQLIHEPTIWPSRSGLEEVVNRETQTRIDMFREAIEQRLARSAQEQADGQYAGVDADDQGENFGFDEDFADASFDGNDSFDDGAFGGDNSFDGKDSFDGSDSFSEDGAFGDGESFGGDAFDRDAGTESGTEIGFQDEEPSEDAFDSDLADAESFDGFDGDMDGADAGDAFAADGDDAGSFNDEAFDTGDGAQQEDEQYAEGESTADDDASFADSSDFSTQDASLADGTDGMDADDSSFSDFEGEGGEMAFVSQIEGSFEQQWQMRSAYLTLVNEQIQQAIERFADEHGRFPTLEEMSGAPADPSRGTSFGAFLDQGFMSEAPVNPFFPSGSASSVGEIGSRAAFEYDPQTGTMLANIGDFTSVMESGELTPVSAQTLASMMERHLQHQIEVFHQLTGSYPTLEQLRSAPLDGSGGSSFGVLFDEGLIDSVPANPFFAGEQATSVGAPGEHAAWIYDEQTHTISAARGVFASVDEESSPED